MSSILNGTHLHLSLFGESHGPYIGCTLHGLPPGHPIDFPHLHSHLARRAPGHHPLTTPRREPDLPQFISGLYNGHTTGAPLTALIPNTDTRPTDYDPHIPRPGHADLTAHIRYQGYNDPRGGGHLSGRLTAPLTLAGALCLQLLAPRHITITSHITSIGPHTPPDLDAAIARARDSGDSLGGTLTCTATGLPPGLGNPLYDTIQSRLAALLFSIPAVKALEFGDGFHSTLLTGSQNNDPIYYDSTGAITRPTNHAGGLEGRLTNGQPLVLRLAIKPTPSISLPQPSINLTTQTNTTLTTLGRHDPCILPRALPVIESAVALILLDFLLPTLTPAQNPPPAACGPTTPPATPGTP